MTDPKPARPQPSHPSTSDPAEEPGPPQVAAAEPPPSGQTSSQMRCPDWLFPERRWLLALGFLAIGQLALWFVGGAAWMIVGEARGQPLPRPLEWLRSGDWRLLLPILPVMVVAAIALWIGARRQRRIRAALLERGAVHCWHCGSDLRHQVQDGRCSECGRHFSLEGLRSAFGRLAAPTRLPLGWSRRVLGLLELVPIIAVVVVLRAAYYGEWRWLSSPILALTALVALGCVVWVIQQVRAWASGRRRE